MRSRLPALAATLALATSGLVACGEDEVSTARPESTPELTLPGGDLTPGDDPPPQGATDTTDTAPTETAPTDTAPTDTTPTDIAPGATTQTDGATAAGQGAAGGELDDFCQQNPGAC